ncbi:GNAT family N-acetyltransferase [Dyadobacter sp. CY323]|uniref:GNAT family N-acetyltransferase n=1 Tax=Dyadobacter sp. CY323 TaxID=2907302 RepID=UPI001F24F6D5|nr:GNAT family N-acetyltransferase [Dyadobacter sp. CY323]MCE6992723.1 GNAT family N-acetyltransferase [Dyadobacter sp. CY323]
MKSEEIYLFLRNCLNQKGYSLSLSQAEFQVLKNRFPDDFPVFSAMDGDKVVALIATVRVARNILYVFISGYLPEYSSFSPIVLLTKEIYGFCQRNGIAILDLGTSLDHHGQQKPELLKFKKFLGGHVCTKVTYCKVFEEI